MLMPVISEQTSVLTSLHAPLLRLYGVHFLTDIDADHCLTFSLLCIFMNLATAALQTAALWRPLMRGSRAGQFVLERRTELSQWPLKTGGQG